jgi:hypothetical protein
VHLRVVDTDLTVDDQRGHGPAGQYAVQGADQTGVDAHRGCGAVPVHDGDLVACLEEFGQ